MSFDYIDYLYLAQELVGQTPPQAAQPEAKLRSAISRAYYAAFLKARAFLEYNTTIIIPKTGEGHKEVWRNFAYSRDGKWRRIGDGLDFLRRSRTYADYDDTIVDLADLVNTTLLKATDLFRLLDELEQRASRR